MRPGLRLRTVKAASMARAGTGGQSQQPEARMGVRRIDPHSGPVFSHCRARSHAGACPCPYPSPCLALALPCLGGPQPPRCCVRANCWQGNRFVILRRGSGEGVNLASAGHWPTHPRTHPLLHLDPPPHVPWGPGGPQSVGVPPTLPMDTTLKTDKHVAMATPHSKARFTKGTMSPVPRQFPKLCTAGIAFPKTPLE